MNELDEFEAERLAREIASGSRKPPYYTEPFRPHDWVIEAIQEAYRRGVEVGYADGYFTRILDELT